MIRRGRVHEYYKTIEEGINGVGIELVDVQYVS